MKLRDAMLNLAITAVLVLIIVLVAVVLKRSRQQEVPKAIPIMTVIEGQPQAAEAGGENATRDLSQLVKWMSQVAWRVAAFGKPGYGGYGGCGRRGTC